MRILCTGDLHVGRRPTRLPASADADAHSCAAAWSTIVRTAIAQHVDLVAISGDLVDQGNKYFEAVGKLESGLRALAEHDIPVVAVAGNHDHDVLPRLADTIGARHFHLLGRGGRWERLTLELPAGRIHVDGWSFPRERVTINPLLDHHILPAEDGAPVLGLLHADLGQTASQYAPVTLVDLRRRACAFWLLGHIHAPALHMERGLAPVLYPGSPQAMDPGEPGCHGAWIVELRSGQPPSALCIPIAAVRYQQVVVDMDGLTEAGEVEDRVVDAITTCITRLGNETGYLRWLCVRLRVTGRTDLRREIQQRLASLGDDTLIERDGIAAFVEHVDINVRPEHRLDELATSADAPGLLARLLLALDADVLDEEQLRLLAEASQRAASVLRTKPYRGLSVSAADELSLVRESLRRQATRLLDELLTTGRVA